MLIEMFVFHFISLALIDRCTFGTISKISTEVELNYQLGNDRPSALYARATAPSGDKSLIPKISWKSGT